MPAPNWWPDLLKRVAGQMNGDPFWKRHADALTDGRGVHLGVFVAPYLEFILAGRKTIESRFAKHRCAPYGRVTNGDVLLLKASSGPLVGMCMISDTWFFDLGEQRLADVRRRFAAPLCAEEDAFWEARQQAVVATLMRIEHVFAFSPQRVQKTDRRGWVTIRQSGSLDLFEAA